ncbi:MAG: hypothetical protein KDC92_12350 [Bacteroidetes bacterium]|nr:hypothetical protein [Bacteroidota bacterium]
MKLSALFLALLFSLNLKAGGELLPSGARAMGLGGAYSVLTDHWGALNNPASLGSVNYFAIGASASRPFGISQLNLSAAAVAIPIKNLATLGLGLQNTSLANAYQQIRAGGAISRQFGENFSAGAHFGIHHFNYANYGQSTFFSSAFGFIFKPINKVRMGAVVHNPFSKTISAFEDERLPMRFVSGFGYEFSDSLLLVAELNMSLDGDYRLHSGIEYLITKNIAFRAGFATRPVETSLGISIKRKYFALNFSLGYHSRLGATPHLSFNYAQTP